MHGEHGVHLKFIGPAFQCGHAPLAAVTLWCPDRRAWATVAVNAPRAGDDGEDTHAAHAALAAGEIRPLSELLARIERECNGQFVEMELVRDNRRWIYEVTLLGPRGDVAELEYDAGDLDLIEAEGHRMRLLDCGLARVS